MLKKFMLMRRRIDPALLTLAVACFGVKLMPDKIVLGLFCGIGLYLVCVRHRCLRLVDKPYAYAAIFYGIVVVLLGMWHGQVEQNARWIVYPLYFLGAVLLWPGFVLIRDPMRQIVMGARICVLLSIGLALYENWVDPQRVGFGGNAANTAFIIAALAVIARMKIDNPLKYLPNTVLWFYIAALPIVLTGTRSILPIFAVALLVDAYRAYHFLHLKRAFQSPLGYVVPVLGLAIVCTTALYTLDGLKQRFIDTSREIESVMASGPADHALTGLEVRVLQWRGALQVIETHPWVGMGAVQSMNEIVQNTAEQHRPLLETFVHVHSFVLDELRIRGVIGLAAQLLFFATIFTRIFYHGSTNIRQNTFIFLSLLLLYGSMHGLMHGDRNIGVMILFFVATLSAIRRRKTMRLRAMRSVRAQRESRFARFSETRPGAVSTT